MTANIDEQSLQTPVGHDEPTQAKTTVRGRAFSLGTHYGLLVLFAAIVVFFASYGTTSSIYLSKANLVTLFGNNAVVCVVALAALVTLTAGYIDLSIGAVTGVSSLVVAGGITKDHLPVEVAIPLAIAVAMALGLINGVLVAKFRLSSIVTTLGMSTALSGVMLWYTNGATIGAGPAGRPDQLRQPQLARHSPSHPRYGSDHPCLLVRPGEHPFRSLLTSDRLESEILPASRHQRGPAAFLVAFTFSGFLAGVAGVLLTARSGAADATTGPSYLFLALAGVFLGATTIHPGRPNAWGTVVGIFFVAFVVSGLSLLGASSWAPDLFNGLILVAAAGLASIFARRRGGGPRML